MAAKGQAKTGGRRKGTPNKLNADVKAMILGALNAAGGQKYLVAQAAKNPVAFLTLVGKILPLQVTGKGRRPVRTPHRYASEGNPRGVACPTRQGAGAAVSSLRLAATPDR
jgi:hypothetical protein